MITANIDISDRLLNRQLDTVKYIDVSQNEVKTIYLALDNVLAGQTWMNGNNLTAKNNM